MCGTCGCGEHHHYDHLHDHEYWHGHEHHHRHHGEGKVITLEQVFSSAIICWLNVTKAILRRNIFFV